MLETLNAAFATSEPRLLLSYAVIFGLIMLLVGATIWLRGHNATREALDAAAREELARLQEQVGRLEKTERDLSERTERLYALQSEQAALRATLSERDNEARRLEQDLGEARVGLTDFRSRMEQEVNDLKASQAELRERLASSTADHRAKADEAEQLRADLKQVRDQRDDLQRVLGEARVAMTDLKSRAEEERRSHAEKLAMLQEAKVQLSDQFKALANDILEEKSKSFAETNRAALGGLLEPLKTQLADFKGKVEEVYVNETKERSALGEQVRNLINLNQQLSKDAHNLTSALRGQAKTQGNWGELILERVLEAAGLTKGLHYETQESHAREDGSRIQPDVVVKLPGERFLVIDSKVSLNAYEDFANEDSTEAEKEAALRRHVESLKGHIRDLSAKNYHDIHGVSSLDFVILFVPIEPAFLVAITRETELWYQAWTKNILLVSPSSLLFVVRTVAHLWQKEQQTRNAQDIARRGAELYDKLVGFVEDLDKLGRGLQLAQDSYEKAYSKFTSGRGNLIRQAEMLKSLGLKPSKQLDQSLVAEAMEDGEIALPPPEDSQSTSS
ncbi:DNA recombination protein RmuC [Oryzibacter oryziterrae]|uniref:DNA recombination protein RmuC n=1 Tax=Oryzibacter oryziterrae TaxID=2766474 RepID=UPI001F48031C|nr:DNA recombination protein RmuC [Oryzibacter oryziterrae]